MKKLFRALLFIFSGVFILLIGALTYMKVALPNVGPAPEMKVDMSQERIERGKYLANHVSVCMDCHSGRDWNKFAGPMIEGTLGGGGEEFSQIFGFPGAFYAHNISPIGLGDWTDGEIFRAITSGVSKNGTALFPVMPHPAYGKMDEEDIKCIIAYLRTLKPVGKQAPKSKADFPMNFIINTIPQKPDFQKVPDTTDQIAYGKYIYTAAACTDCHTKQDNGSKIKGMEDAGGFEFPLPYGGTVRSANITPDKETGIGNWTEEQFVKRFKAYSDSAARNMNVQEGRFNTTMPWTMYAGMKEGDLKALYAYLKTIPPVKNNVVLFSPKE
ncbi:cytochrome C [Sporocytophaga myxococcoides]|uniref:Cytochrome C n=1 Tax=Sporocytophaga myxococcoides TaxID=153721 RepID=A0A098LDR7_9BACT|nr:c-type cytochrome [Sporocytophaga myxococcoides]GAL85136.1 cytochrome C [Sporocytophaga myxococcoides]